jgi:hypothetical protein
VTAVFLEVAADVAYEERPVEDCGDEKTDCGEGPDGDREAHEGEDNTLERGEFLLVDMDVEGEVICFDNGVEGDGVEDLAGAFCQ